MYKPAINKPVSYEERRSRNSDRPMLRTNQEMYRRIPNWQNGSGLNQNERHRPTRIMNYHPAFPLIKNKSNVNKPSLSLPSTPPPSSYYQSISSELFDSSPEVSYQTKQFLPQSYYDSQNGATNYNKFNDGEQIAGAICAVNLQSGAQKGISPRSNLYKHIAYNYKWPSYTSAFRVPREKDSYGTQEVYDPYDNQGAAIWTSPKNHCYPNRIKINDYSGNNFNNKYAQTEAEIHDPMKINKAIQRTQGSQTYQINDKFPEVIVSVNEQNIQFENYVHSGKINQNQQVNFDSKEKETANNDSSYKKDLSCDPKPPCPKNNVCKARTNQAEATNVGYNNELITTTNDSSTSKYNINQEISFSEINKELLSSSLVECCEDNEQTIRNKSDRILKDKVPTNFCTGEQKRTEEERLKGDDGNDLLRKEILSKKDSMKNKICCSFEKDDVKFSFCFRYRGKN